MWDSLLPLHVYLQEAPPVETNLHLFLDFLISRNNREISKNLLRESLIDLVINQHGCKGNKIAIF